MFVIFNLPTYSSSVIGGIKHSIALRSFDDTPQATAVDRKKK